MRSLVIFAFALAVSLAVMDEVSASPDVTSVTINPNAIDNQVDEQVSFQAECSICSEEGGLQYFYWKCKHFRLCLILGCVPGFHFCSISSENTCNSDCPFCLILWVLTIARW